jgi:hypothetical protein
MEIILCYLKFINVKFTNIVLADLFIISSSLINKNSVIRYL